MVTVWRTVLLLSGYYCDSTHQHYDVTQFEYVLWRHTMHEWVMNIHYKTWIAQGRFTNMILIPSKQWGVCDNVITHIPWMFLPLDLIWENQIAKLASLPWDSFVFHLYSQLRYSTVVFKALWPVVFVEFWCHGLTTHPLYFGPFGWFILNKLVCKFNTTENSFL